MSPRHAEGRRRVWGLLLLAVALGAEAHAREPLPLAGRIGELSLSDAERTWLRDHPRIRVHFEPWPPFLVEEQGKVGGITADTFDLISRRLGLSIEWVRTPWSTALEEVRGGRGVQVLPILSRTAEREPYLRFTRNYVSFPIVIFSRQGERFVGDISDLSQGTIVVERDFAMHARLRQQVPASRLQVVGTTGEALQALATGRAHAYVGNLAVGSYLIQRLGLTNLKVAAPAPFGPHEQAIGVRRDLPVLASLLERGLGAVTPAAHQEIRQRWLAVRYEHGLRSSDLWSWVLRVSSVALVLLSLAWMRNRRLGRELEARRRTEEALEQSRLQLEAAQRLARIGSWIYLGEELPLVWSAETFRIFGRSPDAGAPRLRELRELFSPEDWASFDGAVRRALGGEPYEVEVTIRHPDRGERHLVCRGEVEPARRAGEERWILNTVQDVSERRQAQLERERLDARMQQKQRLESLGVLAGGIAHDFNNILAAVIMNAQLALADLPEGASARESVRDILTAARRAAALCRQMLAYSGQPARMERVHLAAVVEEMARILAVGVPKRAKLKIRVGDDLPLVLADVNQIRQVIVNLVTNAAEAIGESDGEISISVEPRHCDAATLESAVGAGGCGPGPYVAIEVRDTGCGMDAETRSRIFEPFFSTKFTGRGLGMAGVLGIVRVHGGLIHVWSEPGKGSALTIYLPAAPGTPRAASAELAPLRTGLGSGTVLIADDDPAVRSALARMLGHQGYSVLSAGSGDEAIALFQDHHHGCSCVILDEIMPGRGGEETLRALRAIRDDVPVLLISGYQEAHGASRTERGERVAFLPKPFDADALATALRQLIPER